MRSIVKLSKNLFIFLILFPKQDGLVPQPQLDTEASLQGPGPPEEVLERMAQTEQLVVQLKEVIREKDILLANSERQLKVRSYRLKSF